MPSESQTLAQERNRPRRLAKLMLALVATMLALGAGELLVRTLRLAPGIQAISIEDKNSPYVRSSNPILRYELRPGFSAPLNAQHQYLRNSATEFSGQSTSGASGTVSINSYGLRDRPRTAKKAAGVDRVLLLGDSVVELINYVSDEATISRQLEIELRETETEVLNFGTAGYCTRAEVELLREKGLQFAPDLVIVLFVENDYWGYNLEHTVGGGIRRRPAAAKSLFRHSALFRLASLQWNLFGYADEFDPGKWHRDAVGDNNVVSGFQLLKQLADEHQFEVVVAIWPSFFKDRIDYRYPLPNTNDLIVEPLAWEQGFATVRLAPYFERHWQDTAQDSQPEWFYTSGDGMHPSVVGCQLAARALAQVVQLREQLPDWKSPQEQSDLSMRARMAAEFAVRLALEPEGKMTDSERLVTVLKRQNRWVEAHHLEQELVDSELSDIGQALANQQSVTETYFQQAMQFRESKPYGARDLLERVIHRDPNHADARYQLALLMEQLQEKDLAIMHLQKLLEFSPDHQEARALLDKLGQQ